MTAEQWKQAECQLSNPFGRVKMQVDGYTITIAVVPVKNLKLGLMVYVNGQFKGEWLTEDCEIRRKFYHCSQRSLLNAKQKKQLQREKKSVREELEKKATYLTFSPVFGSFRTLKHHFLKQNTSIELCKEESV